METFKIRTILSLDLGTHTGWATSISVKDPNAKDLGKRILNFGSEDFSTKRFEGGGMRYIRFQNWLDKMFESFKGVDLVYFEEVRGHKGTAAAHVYGGFLATLTSWCEKNKIPYQGVPVQAIKKFITSKGNASKQMVIDAVKTRGYDVESSDEADAIALMCYVREKLCNV